MKNYEIKASLIGMTFLLLILFNSSLYNDFFEIQDMLISIVSVVIGVIAGLIGAILTGLALLISFLSKETRESFGKENVNKMLNWFKCIAERSGIYLVGLLGLYIALISKKALLFPVYVFYVVAIIYIIGFIYILFYLVAVVRNIIKLFMAKMNFEESEKIELENNSLTFSVQQEVLFNILLKNNLVTQNQLIDTFIFVINSETDINKKNYLIKYFSKYYGYNFENK